MTCQLASHGLLRRAGTFASLLAESGLLIGLFWPGDSLLITAGLPSAQGSLSVWGVIVAAVLGAV